MSDLEAAYRERHLVDTPSGKLMTGQLAAMPPEALDQAYSEAHAAAYGKRPASFWRVSPTEIGIAIGAPQMVSDQAVPGDKAPTGDVSS